MSGIHTVELVVFVLLFVGVAAMGFWASRWKAGSTMDHLDEWGLGGRKFGGWITWFLVGGDLYTAYTFVAVPALVFGSGALGFYALPYTVVLYPIVFLPVLRLWSVSRANGYVTPADFVRGRYSSPTLALIVAITGIVATMPYIALQLVGLESVLRTMGINGHGFVGHLPLFVAFLVLALYTFQSGLRAPALIAFVKDGLIYLVIIVAVIYLPSKLGGWSHIIDTAQAKFDASPSPADGITLTRNNQLQYATLALGSALALFLYPHSATGILASKSRDTIKKNMIALPAYSFLLGLLALLGYVAIAAGVKPVVNNATGAPDTNTIVPALFDSQFGSVFAGIAYAAIGIGALVPAAIMSIAAANMWTRNIFKEYIKRDATPKQEARQAKWASLVVKFGAVAFILFINPQFSIDLQLIGGVIILQTLPAVAIALYTRWLHSKALIAGWVVGMAWGLYLLYTIGNPATGKQHFGGSALALGNLSIFGWHPFSGSAIQIYVGIVALVANLLVAVVVSAILRAAHVRDGRDVTSGADYHADEGDPGLRGVAEH
ncbi:monocarboxylate uptake permease MctP [Nakamurella endophytica]|uniref:Solute:Na+ symporter, SSS family protein n=1 Tax=Nakamurella endophytica TaxID=1748367 RepID=A0A917SM14_9ACTN|nr:sodium:solute symporter [Nakamurella endophytica]GGL87675.1 solute:Na+ symporter, SSS family protein [Nakamurella endophytica]